MNEARPGRGQAGDIGVGSLEGAEARAWRPGVIGCPADHDDIAVGGLDHPGDVIVLSLTPEEGGEGDGGIDGQGEVPLPGGSAETESVVAP